MPLAPLPPDNTKRYFINYAADTYRHSIQCRVASSVSDADAVGELSDFVGILSASAYSSTTWDGLDVAALGSNVRNPVSGWTPITGSQGGDAADLLRPFFFTAVGRATSGRKTKFEMFGMSFTTNAVWRITTADDAAVVDVVDWLVDHPLYFVAIDGTSPVWSYYLNFNYADHWVDVARG